jgi:hypothetical protein
MARSGGTRRDPLREKLWRRALTIDPASPPSRLTTRVDSQLHRTRGDSLTLEMRGGDAIGGCVG